jgi:hypothetical protein
LIGTTNLPSMKKIFAAFCAIVLMPSFSAQAWVGGPFSQNSYFGEVGDTGIYEAIGTGRNAIGIFRIVVDNTGQEGTATTTTTTAVPGAVTSTVVTFPVSGNISIGGQTSNNSNSWFVEGIAYFGDTLGTVNSVLGIVSAIGFAVDEANNSNLADSGFTARTSSNAKKLPASAFRGKGKLRITRNGGQDENLIRFSVFGSKISNTVNYGLPRTP